MVTTVHFFQSTKEYQRILEELKDDIYDVKIFTADFTDFTDFMDFIDIYLLIPAIFFKIAHYYQLT